MHRAACALVAAALSSACASRTPTPAVTPGPPRDACAKDPEAPPSRLRVTVPPWGARVARIEIQGAVRVPVALLRSALRIRVGDALDEAAIAEDLARLDALEVLDGVAVEADPNGDLVTLRFVVEERRRVATVRFRGLDRPAPGRWLALRPGEIFDRARLSRSARGLAVHLFDSGHREARVETRSHVLPDGQVAVCYRVSPGPRYLVGQITFSGNRGIATRELAALLDAKDASVNHPGKPLREDLLAADLLRVTALYYDRGYVSVHVDAPRITLDPEHGRAIARIDVNEGVAYRIGKLGVAGDASIPRAEQLRWIGVSVGEIFSRSAVAAGIERLETEYRRRGRPARVTPESVLNAEQARIDLTFRSERAP